MVSESAKPREIQARRFARRTPSTRLALEWYFHDMERQYAMLEVVDVDGRRAPVRIDADSPARLTIGRDPRCFVVVRDETVSRAHVLIERVDGRWLAENVSPSGTEMIRNGVKRCLVKLALQPGDQLQLGDAAILLFTEHVSGEDVGEPSGPKLTTPKRAAKGAIASQLPELTAREEDLLEVVALAVEEGSPCPSNLEIASALFIAENTVHTHLTSIYGKWWPNKADRDGITDASKRAELVARAPLYHHRRQLRQEL
jgi:DNA-binding CsgD family transcriptional regulator